MVKYQKDFRKGGNAMKRFWMLATLIILLAGVFCLPAAAETAATQVDIQSTVTSDGDCLMTVTVNLRLEAAMDSLTYPVPLDAKSITLNGSNASVRQTNSAQQVDLSRISKGYVGEASVRIGYTLPKAVKITTINQTLVDQKKEAPVRKLVLTVPLLSGFAYPVEAMNFTITMPSNCVGLDPAFTSIYRQESIESDLKILPLTGSQVIGSATAVMNDREGVTMTMQVPEKMFPTVSTYVRDGNPELPYILGFFGAALLYWLLTLRTLPLVSSRASTAPEGITAGELGCRLTLTGGDLTMMVFSWAQLGYLLIVREGRRILLQKRMDMGNERSAFENKVFNLLFSKRDVVDATGNQYGALCRKVAGMVPFERSMYRGNSGNMKIFRGLACIAQGICGVCVAMNMSGVLALAVVMAVILAFVGLISGWLMQDVAYCTHLRGKTPVFIGLAVLALWALLGFLSGQPLIPVCSILGQWVLGFFAAYGGRRSDLGRHDSGQILGLRSYLKHLPRDGINRLLNNDPDYFFNMAPYALALGVIRPYADAFGRRKMEDCPYLFLRTNGRKTADEWAEILRETALLMDERAKQMRFQRWFAAAAPVPRKRKRRQA